MMSDKTSNLGSVYSGMSQEEMMNLINQAKALTASPEQKETARRIDEELDPGGVMRSRFQRPAPAPVAKPKGLAATPQGQVQEDTSMFNLDSVLDYFKGLFTSEPEEKKEDPAPVPAIPTRYSEKYSSNNPGNVERLKKDRRAGENKEGGYGADNRFPTFDHPIMGLRAIFMDMNVKNRRHKGDLFKMISEYAPKSENATKKYYDYVKNKIGKTKVKTPADIRKAVEGIVEYENKNIEDGKLVDFYLSKEYGFMDEAEKLSKINLPSGLSYTDIKSGNYSKGGRVASNPNPYEPRAI